MCRWYHALLLLSAHRSYAGASKPLVPFVYNDYPLGSVTPNGWLLDEMKIEANGLAGHLIDFWRNVRHSDWLGGTWEYSRLNEAFPYWLNGLVPLAYTLNDTRLKNQVHSATDYVLKNMLQEDGWIGPEKGGKRLHWARSLLFLAWTALADTNSTYTDVMVDAMYKYNTLMRDMLRVNGTGTVEQANNTELDSGYYFWGQSRVQEMMLALHWLYENHPRGKEEELLESMELLHHYGYKWEDWYVEGTYATKDLSDYPSNFSDDNFQFLHGVNVGESLKYAAIVRRHTYNNSMIPVAHNAVDWTFKYHGSPFGSIIADERLEGTSPWQGTELCTAVEIIASQAYNFRALGRSADADSAELSAFNALPGAITEDFWAHQYMSQANQPFSKNLTTPPFYDVNTMAQTFGLEPNYPCCTANHPQGLPRFVQYSYLKAGESGVIHALLGPTSLKTKVNGGHVQIDCRTNYPFERTLWYDIDSQTPFDFHVRVPGWATAAALKDQGGRIVDSQIDDLLTMNIPAGKSRLVYTLQTGIRQVARGNDTIAIYEGQLLYAFPVQAKISMSGPHNYRNFTLYPPDYAPPHAHDYTMINETAWNIAIDPTTLARESAKPVDHIDGFPAQLPSPIFAAGAPPNHISAMACLIEWPLIYSNSVPGPPPTGEARKCISDAFPVDLVPYGSAKLHMSELPVIDLSTQAKGSL